MINSILESMNNYIPTDNSILKELKDIPDINEDPMEFMLKVAYENEMNMMKLDQAIIAEEYIYLRENDDGNKKRKSIQERIKFIFQSIKKFLDTAWQKIQMFFKSVFNKFNEVLELDDKFLKKYKEKAKGKKSGKIKAKIAYFSHYLDILDYVEERFEFLYTDGRYYMNAMAKRIKDPNSFDSDKTTEEINFVRDGIKNYTDMSKDKFIKNISKSLGVDDINQEIITEKLSANDAINILENSQKDKNELKKFYSVTKSQIDTCKRHASGIYNDIMLQLKRKEDEKYDKYLLTFAQIVQKYSSIISNICIMLNNFGVEALNKGRSIAKAVIISAIKNDKTSASSNDQEYNATQYRIDRSERDIGRPRDPMQNII